MVANLSPKCQKLLARSHWTRSQSRAACAAAQGLGLHIGIGFAQAQALVPNLHVNEAMPDEDEASLRERARWAITYSPVVAPDPPDGLWMITGLTDNVLPLFAAADERGRTIEREIIERSVDPMPMTEGRGIVED